MVGENEVFIWATTKTGMRWVRSQLSSRELTERVATLRCGLDRTSWDDAACSKLMKTSLRMEIVNGKPFAVLPFDLVRAHELYAALLGPVEDLINDKHLMIVPSGSLTSIPFNVLVTERPRTAFSSKLADYRKVAWLGTRQAISVLPSVGSLKALRQFAKVSHAKKPYFGIGNLFWMDPGRPQMGRIF
jgi:hypothetical protein